MRTNVRQLGGVELVAVRTIYVLIVLLAVGWAFDWAAIAGMAVQRAQYLAMFLALVLLASFMVYSPRSLPAAQKRVPPYDYLLGGAGLIVGIYPALVYEELVTALHLLPPLAVVFGAITVGLLLEAVRRAAGLPLVVIGVLFIGYAFLSEYMPGDFYNRAVSPERLSMYLYVDANAILGKPLAVVMGIVLAFILFGNTLSRTGAADFYTSMAAALMGRFKGGAGKISVVASALMGSISGSAVSNVVSTGVITIPMMKKSGFKPVLAAAIEAGASSGGQLLPPVMGATAFLMAEFLNVPYSYVVIAALIPALMYFFVIFVYVHLVARRDDIPGFEVITGREWVRSLLIGSVYLLPLVVLLYALFVLTLRPERAAYLAALLTLAIHVVQTRGKGRGYFQIVSETGQMTLQIALITAIAGIVIGVLNLTGLGFALTLVLTKVGEINLLLLLVLVALVSMVLGMGMPTTGVYLILAVLVAPAIAEMGVAPIAAHLYILWFGVFSFLTPPVCFAAFAAATIAGTGPMRTGFEAMRLVFACYLIPFLFVYNPGMLMIGTAGEIVATTLFIGLGLYLLSVAVVGFGRRLLSVVERSVVSMAAVLLLIFNTVGGWHQYAIAALAAVIGCTLVWRARPVLTQIQGQHAS